jgi:hypothetical protein
LPDEAALPAGKGSWVVDQNFKTSIGGTYINGYIRVLVQSDGMVFHRKFFDTGQPATPWCQVKFTNDEMREIRGAVAKSNPAAWQPKYGQWISVLAPFRILVITIRGAKDQIAEYKTGLWRFTDLPTDVSAIANAIDDAGTLAFTKCQNSSSQNIESVSAAGEPIYVVRKNGDLVWYKHTGFQSGNFTWVNDTVGKIVGNSWAANLKIFKGNPRGTDGIVYTVNQEGWLSWYKHNGYASGSPDWEMPRNVGNGFNGQQVFSGGNGVIYLINNAGELYWYKHLGYKSGDKIWANNGIGKKVGNTGWKDARFVFSGGDGVIYLIDNRGDLYWSKHLGLQDGTDKWQERRKIGSGWLNLRQVFSGGGGIIYAVKDNGDLVWQKHEGFTNGVNLWAKSGKASEIGKGWNFDFVF